MKLKPESQRPARAAKPSWEEEYEMPDEIDFSKTVVIVGGIFDPDPRVGSQLVEEVAVDSRSITMFLTDGRVFSAPLEWYPELAKANQAKRKVREIRGRGRFVFWPELRFAISPLALMKGVKTMKRESLKRKSA